MPFEFVPQQADHQRSGGLTCVAACGEKGARVLRVNVVGGGGGEWVGVCE